MDDITESRSPTQQKTFERLLAATRELAEAGGYSAVTMNAMAKHAGVSRITAYQYFKNKDHALAELIVALSRELADYLADQPETTRSDRDPVATVQARFSWVIATLHEAPRLLTAVVSSVAAPVPEVVALNERLGRVIADYLGNALAGVPAARAATLERLLGYLFQAVLTALANDRVSLGQAQEDMCQGIALLLGEIQGNGRTTV